VVTWGGGCLLYGGGWPGNLVGRAGVEELGRGGNVGAGSRGVVSGGVVVGGVGVLEGRSGVSGSVEGGGTSVPAVMRSPCSMLGDGTADGDRKKQSKTSVGKGKETRGG